jgi:hypothetical protein
VLVVSAVCAAFPFVQFNLTHQLDSVHQALYFSNTGGGSLASRLRALPSAFASFAAIALPAVVGSPHVCVQSAGDLGSLHWITHLGQPGGLCSRLNQALSLLVMALFALGLWPVLRAVRAFFRRARRAPAIAPGAARLAPDAVVCFWHQLATPVPAADARHAARLWLRAIIIGSVFAWMFAYVSNPGDLVYALDKSRYLVPIYLGTPVLFGTL